MAKQLLIVSCFLMLLFGSCEKDESTKPIVDPTPPPVDTAPGLVCPIGQPVDQVNISMAIGPSGGSLASPDNRIRIEVPAGALTGEQTFTLESITNTNPGGLGLAYRISPHHSQFQKPVSITFQYQENEIANSVPEALFVAYQDEKGIWQAVGGGILNKETKTLTIKTTHFSDWSLFESLSLEPWSASLNPRESLDLKVYRFLNPDEDGFLIPLIEDGKTSPVAGRTEVNASLIEKWMLGGPGVLESEGNLATYTAPNQVIEPVVATVSAKIESPYNNTLLLVSNIMIAAEGITFRVNGGEWIHAPVPLAGPEQGIYLVSGPPMKEGKPEGTIMVAWQGEGQDIVYQWHLEMPQFRLVEGNVQYFHFYPLGNTVVASPGALHITKLGTVGDYLSGTFVLDKAGIMNTAAQGNPWMGTAHIEGFFRVKRTL